MIASRYDLTARLAIRRCLPDWEIIGSPCVPPCLWSPAPLETDEPTLAPKHAETGPIGPDVTEPTPDHSGPAAVLPGDRRISPLLAIESSNPSAHAAPGCAAGVGVFTLEPGAASSTVRCLARLDFDASARHDDALMVMVDRVCSDAGIAPSQLRSVAVSLGPGGYTACRIAATVGQCIGRALGVKTLGVPTALALAHAHAANSADAAETIAVLLAWKRQDVWRQVFTRDPQTNAVRPLDQGQLVLLSDPLAGMPHSTDPRSIALIAEQPTVDRAVELGWAGPADSVRAFPLRLDPASVAGAAFAGLVQPVDAGRLLPIYPRTPEAVTKWEALARAKAKNAAKDR